MATEITFPDSGATVRVNRISPMSLLAIEQAYPDPKPPLQEVDYGNGKTKMERNPLSPEYQDELAAHRNKKNMLILKAFVALGVECEVDAEKVAAYRALMKSIGVDVDPDDKYVFVAHILCSTARDLDTLREAVQGASLPTEKAVAEKLATFPAEVSQSQPV